MLRFVIGVDHRVDALGADIERILRRTYDISEFDVRSVPCSFPTSNVRGVARQVDSILQRLHKIRAQYWIGVSTGLVLQPTACATIPVPMAVITAVDKDGLICCDSVEWAGYYMPFKNRSYSSYRSPDLLDIIESIAVSLAGVREEPLPVF